MTLDPLMIPILDMEVQCLYESLTSLMDSMHRESGTVPSIALLHQIVEYCRMRGLTVDRRPLRGTTTAFCVGLIDRDLIRICSDADEPLAELGEVHECVHFVQKHLPRISLPLLYSQFLALPDEALEPIYHRVRGSFVHCREGFDSPDEYVCERSATKLVKYFEQYRGAKLVASRALWRR